jgi:hypothetical protein
MRTGWRFPEPSSSSCRGLERCVRAGDTEGDRRDKLQSYQLSNYPTVAMMTWKETRDERQRSSAQAPALLELASEILTKLGRHFKCRLFIALYNYIELHHKWPEIIARITISLDLNPKIAPLRPHNPNNRANLNSTLLRRRAQMKMVYSKEHQKPRNRYKRLDLLQHQKST